MPFYAIYTGHIQSGVYETWEECKREIKTPKYKKFDTLEEAQHFQTYGPFGSVEKVDVCVYTDGSCKNNGNEKEGGIGIYFGENDSRNVSKRIYGEKMTNNIAELTAVIECMKLLKDETQKIGIYTDSQYAILCCTTYGEKCKKKKWKDVPNAELVQEAYELMRENINMIHVTAHTLKCDVHSNGNREADRLSKNEKGSKESIEFDK